MASNFGWKAALGILISNMIYFIVFRRQFAEMGKQDETRKQAPIFIHRKCKNLNLVR